MTQSLGAPSRPTVTAGQAVLKGQPIGRPDGVISAVVHAPTSGTVTAIRRTVDPVTGGHADAVVIEADGRDAWAPGCNEPREWETMTPPEIRQAVADAGLVGMGGAAFPTHVKLSPPHGRPLEAVILNGAECEPYLTCDHRAMLERPADIVTGLRVAMAATGAPRGIIAIEDNKPDAAAALRKAVAAASGPGACEVVLVPTKYPQGGERQLILACLGREVPTGGIPADVGAVVLNVQTAAAIADAVQRRIPLIERVVTVSGDAAAQPGNFRVRIGTPATDLLAAAGVTDAGMVGGDLIFGGPMMGKRRPAADVAVTKGTTGLLALRHAAVFRNRPCIRCGECLRRCPARLNPSRLSVLGEARADGYLDPVAAVDAAEAAGLMDCIGCGTCAYVCPSERRIVHFVELLRAARHHAHALRLEASEPPVPALGEEVMPRD
jgi:electron transport complex protein RnfC